MDSRIEGLRELVTKEIDTVVKGGTLNKDTLCNMKEAVHILKDIHKMESFENGGYSGQMMDGRRMSMGERRMSSNTSHGNYMYGNGYSRGDDKIARLEEMMNSATDERERNMIRQWILQMERG